MTDARAARLGQQPSGLPAAIGARAADPIEVCPLCGGKVRYQRCRDCGAEHGPAAAIAADLEASPMPLTPMPPPDPQVSACCGAPLRGTTGRTWCAMCTRPCQPAAAHEPALGCCAWHFNRSGPA